MGWLHRIRSLWRSERLDRDLNDELRFHVEMRTRERIAAGMNPEDARRAAERQFGNATLIKDRTRDMNIALWFETALQDLRYAARTLRRSPAFSSIAIAVLALGIGANSAMFSVVNAVMLMPLPYSNPDRLFYLTMHQPRLKLDIASDALYEIWRKQTQLFDDVAAYTDQSFNLIDKDPERVNAAQVTASFLSTLGVQPALGRGINQEEDRPGGPKAAVLTHSFFERKFHGDASVLGKTIDLDDQPYTVVGILGADFRFPETGDYDLLIPLALHDATANGPNLILDIIARAKPGITVDRARADLTMVTAEFDRQQKNHPPPGTQMKAIRLDREIVGDQRITLLILLGAVGFVLLIACGNVANLLLGRAAARQREVAVRAALGAGRKRLIRQFLTESLLLSSIGAGLGLLLARLATRAVVALGGSRVPFIEQTAIDPRVLAFTAGIAILAGIIFGTVPSIAASGLGFFETLKRGGISTTAPVSHRRFRGALVIAEIALALVLLVGAGLTIKSLWILRSHDPGFQPENILIADVATNQTRYADKARRVRFLKELAEKIGEIPGIAGAGLYAERYIMGRFEVEGRPSPYTPKATNPPPPATFVPASDDFFRAMGIRLLRGSLFRGRGSLLSDNNDAQCHVEINEKLAQAFFANEDPLGRHVSLPISLQPNSTKCTIIGVVSNSSDRGLDKSIPATLYFPLSQTDPNPPFEVSVILRAKGDPLALTSIVRDQVRAVDPGQPIYHVRTMETKLADSIAPRRFSMILLSSFAGLALVLALAGIYAVMFASVSERTHEVGIRLALGANRNDVLRLIAREGALWIAAGLILGIAGSWAATRVLRSQLATFVYGISTVDPWIFVLVPALLTATALIATLVPAFRAARVDPVIALRQE